MSVHDRAQLDRDMVDALRQCMGLDPLYRQVRSDVGVYGQATGMAVQRGWWWTQGEKTNGGAYRNDRTH